MSKFQVKAISCWHDPELFYFDTLEEAKEKEQELKDRQYLVELDEVKD